MSFVVRRVVLAAMWVTLVAVFFVLHHLGAPWGIHAAVAAVSLALVGGVYYAFGLPRLAIQKDLHQGRLAKALESIDELLPRAGTAKERTPLLLHRASALMLLGRWEEGLTTLDDERLRVGGNKVLRLYTLAARFDGLVLSGRLDEAAALFDDQLESLSGKGGVPGARLVNDECRATLLFFDGRLDESQALFKRLVEEARVPPVARASYYFYLGSIVEKRGEHEAADRAFEESIALAPETFFHARIQQIRATRSS